MTSPNRSVIVRLAMEPSSYIAGASRAAAATTALDREVAKVGATSAASMDRAAASAARAEGAFGKASKTAGVFGLKLGELGAAAGLVAAALSVKSAADFQQSLTKLTTTAGESTKNISMVGNGLLDMAGKVGISANELAKGMYTVESGGFHGAAGLKVMSAAAQGAVQEQADLSKVTDAVTTILHDYHLSANDAAKVTSQLVTAVSHGKTTFDELTGSLHSVTPLAAKLGLSLADVTGTLAAMTASGESADQATQNMADTLRHLASPTATMIAELSQLGISTDDLQKSLDQRGLAGTLQMVESAIVDHVDPATKRVLLPALNQSKNASQDLQIMLGKLPPTVEKLARGLMDGSTSLTDYRKQVRALGGQGEVMGTQFMNLYQSSQGFNNVLKAGGPAAQVFTSAMAKSIGTAAGLNVMLQTTGENAGATNAAIKDIAGSSAQADGNIKGWAEVQKNFNQQMHEAGAKVGALAIEFGQHLLPVLTSGFGYINRDVLPAVEHLGSLVGDLGHAFEKLPTPVKDTALALGGLALANKIGLTGLLTGAVGQMAAAFGGAGGTVARLGDQMAVQAKLAQMEAAAVSEVDAALGGLSGAANGAAGSLSRVQLMLLGWDDALAATTVETEAAAAATVGFGTALSTVAVRGAAAAASGFSRVIGMLGGPWVVGIAAAAAGVYGLVKAIQANNAAIERGIRDVQSWDETVALGMGGQSAIKAAENIDNIRSRIATLQKQIAAAGNQPNEPSSRNYIDGLRQQLNALENQLDKGNAAWKRQLDSMTPVQEAQMRVKIATKDLTDAEKDNAANSPAVAMAAQRLADANANLATETGRANAEQKTQIQRLQDQASAALGSIQNGIAAAQAQQGLNDSITQFNKDSASGQVSAAGLVEEQTAIAQSAISAAQAAGQYAASQAKAKGVTDTANASNQAQLQVLQQVQKQMGTATPEAIILAIKALKGATVEGNNVTDAVKKMGLTTATESGSFRKEFEGNATVLKTATAGQIKDLQDLGYTVTTLPNHQILVSANTQAARDAITQLTKDYHNYSINVGIGGIGARLARAAGGPIAGPGTATSDSIPVMASNGEHMWTAAEVEAAGGHGAMFALRSAVLGGALKRAGGGPVTFNDMFLTAKVGVDPGSLAAAKRALTSMSFAPGAPGNVNTNAAIARQMAAQYYGWTGAQWNALYALGQRESGWNNTAQNPTSTAYGIPQFLNSTWATVGLSKTSNPYVQIAGMDKYIQQRYGTPINAWAHETRYGWYRDGTDYVPFDMPAMLHKGEAVVPATENARVRSREVSGGGYGGSAAGGTTINNVYNVTAPGPTTKELVRALARHQYQQEFLNA